MQRGNDLQQKRVVVVGGSSGIGWQCPNRRPRKEPKSLSSPAMRNEFRKPLSVSLAKHRGRRSTSRTKEPLQPSLRSLAVSIIWYSRRR